MSPRPLVAVPAMRSPRVEGLRRAGLVMAERIAECLLRAGGEPVLLVPDDAPTTARLAAFDAVLLPGGRDLDPSWYGAARGPHTDPGDLVQDAADLAAASAVVVLGMPALAVCRGLQVLNVALGGSLHQHLDDAHGLHRNGFHDVDLAPGSEVAVTMGAARVRVSSYHHQAVDRLGEGLRVVGRADDGTVEAAVHESAPVVGVQWHPEDDAHEVPAQQALFDALVERAGVRTGKVRVIA